MSTTALIVEIVVIGMLNILALFTELKCFNSSAADYLYESAKTSSNHAMVLAVLLSVAYAVGWAVNSLAYAIAAAVFRAMEDRQTRRTEKEKSADPNSGYPVEDMIQFSKVFFQELWARLGGVGPELQQDTLGNLGNYDLLHARVMQGASDYSTRFLADHFSMLRIDRASFFTSFLFLPAAWAGWVNPYWLLTGPLNVLAIVILYLLTKKAYIYYKKLRNSVGEAIAEQSSTLENPAK